MAKRTKDSYKKRLSSLENGSNTFRAHWLELSEYLLPYNGLYLSNTNQNTYNRGEKKGKKIINGMPTEALKTLASGLFSGLTPSSSPWFMMTIDDEDTKELEAVKVWLHNVRNIMLGALTQSNFYDVIAGVYNEIGGFGTSAMILEEDFDNILRFRQFTIGSYYLANDKNNRANVLYRKFTMTAQQMVEEFGVENVTDSVKQTAENNDLETSFGIVHCIQPNTQPDKFKDFEYESIYFQEGAMDPEFLRESGYTTKPFAVARWDIIGDGVYGDNCPGMMALGDIKMLQKMEKDKLQGLDKAVRPPMNAPSSLKNRPKSTVSGAVTYVDSVATGQQGFTPTYLVNLDYQNIAFELDRVESRIKKFFFNELFFTVSSQTKSMTATEVVRRHEERVMIFGAVLERLQSELFDDTLSRVYSILDNLGMIPEPPQEIIDKPLEIRYISQLAQSQKAIQTTSLEQITGFVSNIATLNPSSLDKIDFDEIVDQYSEMVGVQPKVIRTDDEVAVIREDRAKQQQAAQMVQAGKELADTSKTLSDTKMNTDSALDGLVGDQA